MNCNLPKWFSLLNFLWLLGVEAPLLNFMNEVILSVWYFYGAYPVRPSPKSTFLTNPGRLPRPWPFALGPRRSARGLGP